MFRKIAILSVAAVALFAFAFPASAEVNDSKIGFQARGALGAGNIFWGYVSHSNAKGDLGAGKGGTINLAGMFNYWIVGLELNMLFGNIGKLKWSDEDNADVSHNWESDGSGHYAVYDLKLGAKLFAKPGDMGYTFFYFGGRWWETERNENTLTYDGLKLNYENKYEGKGNGWIIGFRDMSTFGPANSLAFVLQTGFFFGKAPVDKFKVNGVNTTQPNDDSAIIGGEIAGGVALQNLGFSIVGGFRGEINATTFKDTAAPDDEESVFGFGNITFFVEAGIQI